MPNSTLKVALAQIAPIWLDKAATLEKVKKSIKEAAENGAELIVFGEGLVPGYPWWLPITNATAWDNKIQKEIHAHYVRNAVQIEAGDLNEVQKLAAAHQIAVYLGIIERPIDRGGHSLFCSLVYINQQGEICSVHRKLQPTYDERLTWSPGDGHGLQVHPLKEFTVGGLNCWENWMPLARTALYGLGENLHIAVWPGAVRNTENITRMIAQEGRSYVISVSSLMRKNDFPTNTPHLEVILENCPETLGNGGSCIAGPDGKWILEPVAYEEGILYHTLDFNRVLEERQNFDPVGHYSRPDVLELRVNRERQSSVRVE
ncbi:carbon-nitrogen hydrolase family protein [Algoriphagus sp.]|jgi:nitrilase|uniref:carbon-nitrogen hydrolase family protein n=1 Tax=Algoriphagus sp. TaxID=1872435 RepID=UPI00271CECB8|nr:carbon-nitrogen hydrolase family protein [Algoriphagus sp.]MDO8968307.1 carbon-nitrogen hydrolase family protein [Algoriphagus sp.]MDP3200102.1 carbon-nitrogen hydrolase family protein [Algoriphagus sp.]